MPTIDESDVSIRFKYGIHTIFLFVNTIATRAAVSTQLLRVLRDRYPNGLRASLEPGPAGTDTSTAIPAALDDDDDLENRVEFAAPTMPKHPQRGGWTKIDVAPEAVLLRHTAVKNGGCLAFRFVSGRGKDRAEEDDSGWPVVWAEPPPVLDERDAQLEEEEEEGGVVGLGSDEDANADEDEAGKEIGGGGARGRAARRR